MTYRDAITIEVRRLEVSPLRSGDMSLQIDMTDRQVKEAICCLLGGLPEQEGHLLLRSEFPEMFSEITEELPS